ncbi:hypothetical protein C8J57DRAFT_1237267 [Mycena rebaudengoi]|nr:hypothetical protein C8J57DRAFT_1237267 [Mycena rebaudengoi]
MTVKAKTVIQGWLIWVIVDGLGKIRKGEPKEMGVQEGVQAHSVPEWKTPTRPLAWRTKVKDKVNNQKRNSAGGISVQLDFRRAMHREELLEEGLWIEPPPARLPEIDLRRAIHGEELLEEDGWMEPPPARLPEIDLWRAIHGEELLEEDGWIELPPARLPEVDSWRGTPGGRRLS